MGAVELFDASAAAQRRVCLTFRLGSEEYGIDILRVQEIRGYERPTRVAHAPDFVKGVVNLRGVIVPATCATSISARITPGSDPPASASTRPQGSTIIEWP